MEIKKTSSTYRKYIAGAESYAKFFDEPLFSSGRNGAGFCSMMRTIYFWRPFVTLLKVLLLASVFAVVGGAWYFFSTEIILGAIEITLFVGCVWLGKMTATALGIKTYFEPEEMPLVFQWINASYDKICPLVTFTEEENEASS